MSALGGVTFRAWRGKDFVPLIEVLVVIGPGALHRRWSLNDTEFAPGWRGSEQLERIATSGDVVPTLQLVDLVADGIQLVDGELVGEDESRRRPPLIIRSVRGDDWDVETEDEAILRAVRGHFEDVKDLPHG